MLLYILSLDDDDEPRRASGIGYFGVIFMIVLYILYSANPFIYNVLNGVIWNIIYILEVFIPLTVPLLVNSKTNPYWSSGRASEDPAEGYVKLGTHIALCIFTFGIYTMVWIYRATVYLNRDQSNEQQNPTAQVLLCMFVPFYIIYWFYKQGQKSDSLTAASTLNDSPIATLCLVFGIFVPLVSVILIQDRINKLICSPRAASVPVMNMTYNTAPVSTNPPISEDNAVQKMETLKSMLDNGLITQEEFEQKKQDILSKI